MTQPAFNSQIEPLTAREMDVLALLAQGLSNQEIAEDLVMEVSTIKWYNHQIYGKLQVQNRRQAVTRALTLGLLSADSPGALHQAQHNLPADSLPFIGRAREINDLSTRLTNDKLRLITILGPGGMGKSRLSIEVGRRLLGYFMQGVYFVPLAAVTSTDQIITTIAEVIHFSFHSDVQPRQQLAEYLQKQQMLLIIDNFEHLLDDASLLSDLLRAAPNLKLLVTSREKLGLSGEVLHVIDGLSIPFNTSQEIIAHDAVKLFVEAASRTTSPLGADDLEKAARICQLLGGMPLAILLASGWLDTLSLAEIENELRAGLDILEATRRDGPQRHQSIEAVFDSSWSRLSAEEQVVFMRLSVFRGGYTREAAMGIAGASIHELQRLVHTSFIRHLPSGRYAVHELMRQYGQEKLADSGALAQVREQHAHYFARFIAPVAAQGWLQQDPDLLEQVNQDFENVRAAWHYYIEHKAIPDMLHMLDGIWPFLDAYSRSQEMVDILEAVLPQFRDDAGNEALLFRGEVLALLGWFYGDIGLKHKAFVLTTQSLAILEPLGTSPALLLAHTAHIILMAMTNRLGAGLDMINKCLALAQEIGDERWQGVLKHLMAFAYLNLGEYQQAIFWAEQTPEEVHMSIKGAALSGLGDYQQAEAYLLQALRDSGQHRYGNTVTYGRLLENAALSGNHEQGWHYLQRGLHFVDDFSLCLGSTGPAEICLATVHGRAVLRDRA